MASVRQRKDGRWEGRLRTRDGRRLSVYGMTEADALAKLRDLERRCWSGKAPPIGKSVNQLLDHWLDVDRHRWKPTTEYEYRRMVERVVRPELGSTKLGRLQPDHLHQLFNGLRDRPKLARNVYRILHRAFTVAVRWGWIPSNPCDRIEPPVYQNPQPVLPPVQELIRFLEETRDHWLWPWLVVALHTGIRPGEQAPLRWTEVNAGAGVIRIIHTGRWIDGHWFETSPKSQAGTRTIHASPQVWDALERQAEIVSDRRYKAGTQWEDWNLVFPSTRGQPLAQNTVGKALTALCERHDIPRLTPHKLRHCHASILLEQGIPITHVSRRLGHSNAGITMTIYAHALGGDDQVAEAISQALGG